MTKPQEFNDQKIVRHESRYQVDERFPKGPQAGTGVLSTGRVVWTATELAEDAETVSVFADGIGVVSVEAHSLQP